MTSTWNCCPRSSTTARTTRSFDGLFDTFGPRKLVWGSEFVTYNVTGPPFTAERYREHLRYLERRCDYLSQDDLDLILGGNLDAVFSAYERK